MSKRISKAPAALPMSAKAAAEITPESRQAAIWELENAAKFAGAAIATLTRWACQLETDPERVMRHLIGEVSKTYRPNAAVAASATHVLTILAPEAAGENGARVEARISKRQLRQAYWNGHKEGQNKERRELRTMVVDAWKSGQLGLLASTLMTEEERSGNAAPMPPPGDGDNIVPFPPAS